MRVHEKVVAIIREEMDAIGGQELLMPVLNPAEIWKRTGRHEIDELFKLQDRKGADMVLAMIYRFGPSSPSYPRSPDTRRDRRPCSR
jgi:prolyl-tRNA synthetase